MQRVPAWVVPRQRLAELVPETFFGSDFIPEIWRYGGRQILHGVSPLRSAFSMPETEETFLTIRQLERWYFVPEGVR
ncbi:hypothetical protein [Kaistella sp. PBT33-4]|uniref:hypothetical protein n=1 Tax=Kaistella sp. PBT33-4 TaxID=3032000 RepID=UPI0023D88155|nr:hypothetical protein [Kaistella sp. PBT33-4]